MGWVVVGTAVFGAPRFCMFLWKYAVFLRVLAKNRGAPKTAVPTATHSALQLTPSEHVHFPADARYSDQFHEGGGAQGDFLLRIASIRCVQLASFFGNVTLGNSKLTAIYRSQATK